MLMTAPGVSGLQDVGQGLVEFLPMEGPAEATEVLFGGHLPAEVLLGGHLPQRRPNGSITHVGKVTSLGFIAVHMPSITGNCSVCAEKVMRKSCSARSVTSKTGAFSMLEKGVVRKSTSAMLMVLAPRDLSTLAGQVCNALIIMKTGRKVVK